MADLDWIEVEGESMSPFLRPGDWIGVDWIKNDEPSKIRSGELLVARVGETDWIVHRVVAESGELLRLKGDLSSSYETLPRQKVFGRVSVIRPRSSRYSRHLRYGSLDSFIALASRLVSSESALVAFAGRRLTRALGRLRRALLWK